MDRELFDSLTVQEQLEFVNGELGEEKSLTQIAKSLNMSRSTLSRRFEKINHKFDKGMNLYVNVHNVHKSTNVCTQSVQTKSTQCVQKTNNALTRGIPREKDDCTQSVQNVQPKSTQSVQPKSTHSVQEEILKKIDDIHKILMNERFDIKVDIMSSEYVSKTFRVEKNILNAFQELCKTSNYSQQELISKALIEFINNYQ